MLVAEFSKASRLQLALVQWGHTMLNIKQVGA